MEDIVFEQTKLKELLDQMMNHNDTNLFNVVIGLIKTAQDQQAQIESYKSKLIELRLRVDKLGNTE